MGRKSSNVGNVAGDGESGRVSDAGVRAEPRVRPERLRPPDQLLADPFSLVRFAHRQIGRAADDAEIGERADDALEQVAVPAGDQLTSFSRMADQTSSTATIATPSRPTVLA